MATRSKNTPPRSGSIAARRVDSVFDKVFNRDTAAPKVVKPAVGKPANIRPKKQPADPYAGVKPLSFKQLFSNALRTDATYVDAVQVYALKKGRVQGWPGFITKSITIDGKKPRRYNHHVVARDGKPVVQSNAVHVTCQCARFLYYYEYSLNKRGAADIVFSNGEPPLSTNPRLIPSACKHVLAVMRKIIDETGADNIRALKAKVKR